MMDCRNPERDHRRRNRILARAEAHPADHCHAQALNRAISRNASGEHPMKRFLSSSCWPRPSSPDPRCRPEAAPRSRSIPRPTPLTASRRHLSRRSRRRGDEFARRYFRLHADRPSDDLASARRARSRMAARGCSSSIATASSSARSARTATASCSPQQVRVDPQDNIWVVDQMTNMVMKFDPQGRVAMLLGRKAGGRSTFRRGRRRRAAAPRRRCRAQARRATCSTARPTWPGTRRQHLRRRRPRQRARRQVRQERRVRQVLGLRREPGRASSPTSAASPSTRKAMSTPPTAETSASRSSTTTAPSRRSITNVGNAAGALHDARAESGPLHLQFQSAERYRRRR